MQKFKQAVSIQINFLIQKSLIVPLELINDFSSEIFFSFLFHQLLFYLNSNLLYHLIKSYNIIIFIKPFDNPRISNNNKKKN